MALSSRIEARQAAQCSGKLPQVRGGVGAVNAKWRGVPGVREARVGFLHASDSERYAVAA